MTHSPRSNVPAEVLPNALGTDDSRAGWSTSNVISGRQLILSGCRPESPRLTHISIP